MIPKRQPRGATIEVREMKIKMFLNLLALVLLVGSFASAEDSETILHNFSGGSSNQPAAGLIADSHGNLFGVTGVYGVNCGAICGTVFELSPTSSGWTYSTIYGFKGGVDGSAPQASLLLGLDGNLYGTTSTGGGKCKFQVGGCGTVFKLSPNSSGGWTETVLHRFSTTTDGALPFTPLVQDASGNLYGGTDFAGLVSPDCPQGCGTIFELSPNGSNWTFSVIHTFTGGADGAFGSGLLLDASGNLYGGTGGGGIANSRCGGEGCGIVFKMTPNAAGWTKSTLDTFTGGSDGFDVLNLIFDASGNIFGATLFAGHGDNTLCAPLGCGTIFELSPSGSAWTFKVIHDYIGADGVNPSGIVFDSAGNLYGATERGGPSCCGTIFKLVPDGSGNWTQDILFAFTGGTDGNFPPGPPVVDASGNLFGVTGNGGTTGAGVAFELTP